MKVWFSIFTLSLLVSHSWAVNLFTAERECEAYVSKNNLTNPGNVHLKKGEKYEVLETNRANRPDWYRLMVKSASPPERWVNVACGKLNNSPNEGNRRRDENSCQVAKLADSQVLALSWQPAFCEDHRSKPECQIKDPAAYQAHNFTLHGLWPNKNSCGKNYGFCGKVKKQSANFCDYPEVTLNSKVGDELGKVMPGVKSCLERHEWHKHGTCSAWQPDEYFQIAVNLTRQFNESGVASFISSQIGKPVEIKKFLEKVDSVLGKNARQKLELTCQKGNLVDLLINLPGDLKPNESLSQLMARAKDSGNFKTCGKQFYVDPIGFANR